MRFAGYDKGLLIADDVICVYDDPENRFLYVIRVHPESKSNYASTFIGLCFRAKDSG